MHYVECTICVTGRLLLVLINNNSTDSVGTIGTCVGTIGEGQCTCVGTIEEGQYHVQCGQSTFWYCSVEVWGVWY